MATEFQAEARHFFAIEQPPFGLGAHGLAPVLNEAHGLHLGAQVAHRRRSVHEVFGHGRLVGDHVEVSADHFDHLALRARADRHGAAEGALFFVGVLVQEGAVPLFHRDLAVHRLGIAHARGLAARQRGELPQILHRAHPVLQAVGEDLGLVDADADGAEALLSRPVERVGRRGGDVLVHEVAQRAQRVEHRLRVAGHGHRRVSGLEVVHAELPLLQIDDDAVGRAELVFNLHEFGEVDAGLDQHAVADADLAHGVDVALHEFGHLVRELDEAWLFVPAVDRDVLADVLARAPVLGETQRGNVVHRGAVVAVRAALVGDGCFKHQAAGAGKPALAAAGREFGVFGHVSIQ